MFVTSSKYIIPREWNGTNLLWKYQSLNYSQISLGGFPPWFWKADAAYFYCKILRVQFLAVFTREKELAASRGGLGKQSTRIWVPRAEAGLRQAVVSTSVFLLAKGAEGKEARACFSGGSREHSRGGWNIFKKKHRSVLCFFISMALAYTFQREEGDAFLVSLPLLLSVH